MLAQHLQGATDEDVEAAKDVMMEATMIAGMSRSTVTSRLAPETVAAEGTRAMSNTMFGSGAQAAWGWPRARTKQPGQGLWLLGMTSGSSMEQPRNRSLGTPEAPTESQCCRCAARELCLEKLVVHGALKRCCTLCEQAGVQSVKHVARSGMSARVRSSAMPERW